MKNIFVIIAILIVCLSSNQSTGQSVNLESAIKANGSGTLLSVQRIEITNPIFTLKYDYKASGGDVLGIIIPNVWSNSTSNLSGMIIKTGDGNSHDQFAFDAMINTKFGKLNALFEAMHVVNSYKDPWNFIGARLTYGNFTTEAYIATKHLDNQGLAQGNAYYTWVAYHPKHAFVALGKQEQQYWGYIGTKELQRFGSFAFINYQPETKNFWFKSQTGFGAINQKFFCQENYILATSYLTITPFYYLHFSPIVTKGTLTVKIEGKQAADIQNYEIMLGKQLGNNLFGFATGINSEYNKTVLKLSPSFELYKSWKTKLGQCIVELRYDHLHQMGSAFFVIRY
ncbi:MAG TPA: hypothetical protein VFD16_00130 [Candidatus Saccharimonadales bacterium]|nr:hypothetical protein [Candidatus Saccharimonadales bacterium]